MRALWPGNLFCLTARAWQLHKEEGMRLEDVCDEVLNLVGEVPSVKAVWRAVQMVQKVRHSHAVPQTKYANCGRHRALTPEQERAVRIP